MADVVQSRLERMAKDELDDLERRGLFTRREIAEIVKQRRKFEYRLKRPSPLKQDFLAYIEYETQVDSLRMLRKKTVARDLKSKGGKKKKKKSVSDFAGVSRIVNIYQLAVNRYKGDVGLWLRYIEFCRQRKNGRMKKVLAQVIRFHPKVPGIWIYAAAWEFDHNLNAAAARALMQSGLRVCPNSEELWVEYLRMELTYLNKLKARKVALGEDEGTLIREHKEADEEKWRDENKDLFMSLDEERQENDKSDVENTESKKKLDLFQKQGLSVLRTIYSGAIEALPSSFSLRKLFFEILEVTDVAHMGEMRTQLLSDMKRDFAVEPEYWDWLARLEKLDLKCRENMEEEIIRPELQKSVQVYEEALNISPSAKMFDFYTKFLMDVITETEETLKFGLTGCTGNFVSHLLMVYEKAEKTGFMTEDLACQYISFYMQLGQPDEAKKQAEKLCSGKFSDSVKLWLLRASIEVRCVTRNSPLLKADMLSVFEVLRYVLTKVSVSEAKSLWLMTIKFFANQKHYFDKLVEISLVSLVKDGGSDDGFSLSSTIVNFVLQKDGIQHAQEMYKRFLVLPRPGLALYRSCIELETNLASIGDKDCLANARKLYESAVTSFDQNVSLWRDYHSMETKLGTSETAYAVHWRARKTLKDPTELIATPVL